jgi:hypothetical protein
MKGLGVAQIGKRYTLADWEVENALRLRLSEQMQGSLLLGLAPPEPPATNSPPDHPVDDDTSQLTIAEVYGSIEI